MENKTGAKIIVYLGAVGLIIHLCFLGYRYFIAAVDVEQRILSNNIIYLLLALLLPIFWWILSTGFDKWNFYQRKKATLGLVALNFLLTMLQPLWSLTFNRLIVQICRIPIGRNMDVNMILNLCRISLIGISALIGYAFYALYKRITEAKDISEKIEGFRLQHIVDTRENKEHAYDLKIMKDMKTGSWATIREVDRFVHMFVLGSSGTGKTSSTYGPMVINDLNRKVANAKARQAALRTMIAEGRASVRQPLDTEKVLIREAKEEGGFANDLQAERLVTPGEDYVDEYKAINKKYPDCGITIMAPNNSLNDDVIDLCAARNLKVNVIDPAFDRPDATNVRLLGINPFYVEIGLDPETRLEQINSKASTFAEVLMTVNELNGTGDQYFRDINTSVTSNIAIACMLRANLKGEQTNITEIQECINEFHILAPIIDEIQEALHMQVIVRALPARRGRGPQRADEEAAQEDQPDVADAYVVNHIETEEELPDEYYNEGYTVEEYNELLDSEADAYYETIHFIMQELLGDGAEKMFDQARGLRNLINKLLLDPRIKKILSASDDNFIDWDKALRDNEITVINTALEYGKQSSTALGLFIMLNMQISILRRPKNTRTDHFLMIDEASQYMHNFYEHMFALYRQYRVACALAMQSLSQMDKTNETKFLKGVIMGAGIHIVFGRVNADEMKVYEAMAGLTEEDMVQKTRSSNSEFDEHHAISQSERTTSQQVNVLDGSKIRNRDFQEVTVYMVESGRVKPGFIAKVSFPDKADYYDKHIKYVDWAEYLPDHWLDYYTTEVEIKANTDSVVESHEAIKRARVGIDTTEAEAEEDHEADTIPAAVDDGTEDRRSLQRQVPERDYKKQEFFEKQRSLNGELEDEGGDPDDTPLLDGLIEDHPDSPYTAEANERLALLNARKGQLR